MTSIEAVNIIIHNQTLPPMYACEAVTPVCMILSNNNIPKILIVNLHLKQLDVADMICFGWLIG